MDVSSERMEPSFQLVGVMGWRERETMDPEEWGWGTGRRTHLREGKASFGVFFPNCKLFILYWGIVD